MFLKIPSDQGDVFINPASIAMVLPRVDPSGRPMLGECLVQSVTGVNIVLPMSPALFAQRVAEALKPVTLATPASNGKLHLSGDHS